LFFSDWSLDSSTNSLQEDGDSPARSNIRSYLIIDETDEISSEIVPRASNPIVNDINFMRCNQEQPLKLNFGSTLVVRP